SVKGKLSRRLIALEKTGNVRYSGISYWRSSTPMTVQEKLIEAVRGLPPLDQQKVLEFVERLHPAGAARESLYARAKRLGRVGIVTDAPSDLSTNKHYLDDFGRD